MRARNKWLGNKMISIITGDIIDSRQLKGQESWIAPLKTLFDELGPSPEKWDIYRGDNFQLEIDTPENALLFAIRIKALVKSLYNADVRMAIGIGTRDYHSDHITECNGEAFVHSGLKYESLKKEKQNMAIKSPWPDFDKQMNLYLRLSLIAMDSWSAAVAQYVAAVIANPGKSQLEIAQILGITQPSASDREKRAYWDEVSAVEKIYREGVKEKIGA